MCVEVGWLARPGPPQRGEDPVAAAVAGEHPAGPVAAVRGRRQPDDGDPGVGRAEAGHRAPPVVLVAERGPLDPRDLLPPRHQPRAGAAAGDPGVQDGEVAARRAAAAHHPGRRAGHREAVGVACHGVRQTTTRPAAPGGRA